jgi:hypothetical protein
MLFNSVASFALRSEWCARALNRACSVYLSAGPLWKSFCISSVASYSRIALRRRVSKPCICLRIAMILSGLVTYVGTGSKTSSENSFSKQLLGSSMFNCSKRAEISMDRTARRETVKGSTYIITRINQYTLDQACHCTPPPPKRTLGQAYHSNPPAPPPLWQAQVEQIPPTHACPGRCLQSGEEDVPWADHWVNA